MIPTTYAEAIEAFPQLRCETWDWEHHSPLENAVWLIESLSGRLEQAEATRRGWYKKAEHLQRVIWYEDNRHG